MAALKVLKLIVNGDISGPEDEFLTAPVTEGEEWKGPSVRGCYSRHRFGLYFLGCRE